jgi:hypothetical protein
MKTPCYTTKTGIRIGSAYQPPLRQLSYEESRVQSALLGRQGNGLSAKAWALIGLVGSVFLMWISI